MHFNLSQTSLVHFEVRIPYFEMHLYCYSMYFYLHLGSLTCTALTSSDCMHQVPFWFLTNWSFFFIIIIANILASCIVSPCNDILCILHIIDCTDHYEVPWMPIKNGLRIKSAQKLPQTKTVMIIELY